VPLFMDRHDLPDLTAQQVARAHLNDLRMEGKHGVQFLAYWFDTDNEEAFCLARAPAAESVQAVHQEAHGLVANEIISVSEDKVLRFLGKISQPPEAMGEHPLRTVLFTDLEGSTALIRQVGESSFIAVLTEHDVIIRRALVATRGHEVKHTGDGIMASFADVGLALECALRIQDGFDARAAAGETPELRVRIGLAAGHPVDHNDDMFGSAVNLASRICEATEAGHILVTDLVRDLGDARGYAFRDAGERALKGFSSPVGVFELIPMATVPARYDGGPRG